ncbi:hypothetical protein RAC89_28040 [Paenibacillus sp. GD4]|uniref:hypothetical protein n=1 Tax=Paenibacillus sp. GD4 TaxID=3068890 RepID=UPI0027963F8D|nr:hypothetical protein [Paenibacillus sp. GD4]MDQ1914253.1 hypothetical protein [Paenibacillus sp. GD4]
MERTQIPIRSFNPKRPGTLVGIIMTVSEYLGALYGSIAETRVADSYGPCAECSGTVASTEIDHGRMIAPELSLKNGAVLLWAGTNCAPVPRIKQLAAMLGIDYLRPLEEQDPGFISVLLYGHDKEPVSFVYNKRLRTEYYRGCVSNLQSMINTRTTSKGNLKMISFFSKQPECSACRGTGLSKGLSDIYAGGLTLAEVNKLPIDEMLSFIKCLRQSIDEPEAEIVEPIIIHLVPMLLYLSKIGLRTLPPVVAWRGLPAFSS